MPISKTLNSPREDPRHDTILDIYCNGDLRFFRWYAYWIHLLFRKTAHFRETFLKGGIDMKPRTLVAAIWLVMALVAWLSFNEFAWASHGIECYPNPWDPSRPICYLHP